MIPKMKGINENPELIKLEEMFQMQREVDELFHRGVYEFPKEQLQLALLDEIGELNHELKPDWCYWKKSIKPKEYAKVLEEYVDCLHFVLSLCAEHGDTKFGASHVYSTCVVESRTKTYTIYFKILQYIGFDNPRQALVWFFRLGNRLGISLDDVYNAYVSKNKVNYERLNGDY